MICNKVRRNTIQQSAASYNTMHRIIAKPTKKFSKERVESNLEGELELLRNYSRFRCRTWRQYERPIEYPHVTARQFMEIKRRIFEITDYLGLPCPQVRIVGSRAEEKPLPAGYHDVDVVLMFNPQEVERRTTYHGWYAQEGQIKEVIEDILKFRKMSFVEGMEIEPFVVWI